MKKQKQHLAFFEGGERAKKAEVIRSAALTPEAERLLANFEVLAEAPGGIKRLRELILGLAVQGKLVPQDAWDESAKILADKIASAKPKLASKCSMRIGEPLPPVEEADEPYSIPASWRWIRLGDCGGFLGGGTPSKSNSSFWEGSMPWVSPKDMKRLYIDDAEDHISEAAVEGSSVKLIPNGSLLFVIRGMILAHSFPTAITTKPVTINQDMKALVLALPPLGEYLLRACQAGRARMLQRVERSSHGTCRLDSNEVDRFPIALPPLAEQARIVAKVDELMALCDEMEARQAKRRVAAGRLNKAALGELTSAEGPEELAASLRRVVGNFEALVDKPESISDLRTALIDLAMSGRIDPSPRTTNRCQWPTKQLADVALSTRYGTSQKCDYGLAGNPVLRIPNVVSGVVDLSDLKFTALPAQEAQELALQEGDLLVVRSNGSKELVGRAAIVPKEAVGFAFAGYLIRVRLPRDVVDPRWAHLALKGSGVRQSIERPIRTTSGVHNINTAELLGLSFCIPPVHVQLAIVARVDHLLALCDTLEAKLRVADEGARRLAESLVAELLA